jgi:hypothetical protein
VRRPRTSSGGAESVGCALTAYPACDSALLVPWQKEQLVSQAVHPAFWWQVLQLSPEDVITVP